MPTLSILEAQARMDELIERVQLGEEFILTDGSDETPVAKLMGIPLEPKKSQLPQK